jgi:hypothetical protein
VNWRTGPKLTQNSTVGINFLNKDVIAQEPGDMAQNRFRIRINGHTATKGIVP